MVKIFISYSHENSEWLDGNSPYSLLKFWRRALGDEVEFWFDRDEDDGIKGGDRWRDKIFENIDDAHIAVLLITEDFIVSPFIRQEELPYMVDRSTARKLEILPILVEPARWRKLNVHGLFQLVPGDPTPISGYIERGPHAWKQVRLEVVDALEKVVERVKMRGDPPDSVSSRDDKGPEGESSEGALEPAHLDEGSIKEKQELLEVKKSTRKEKTEITEDKPKKNQNSEGAKEKDASINIAQLTDRLKETRDRIKEIPKSDRVDTKKHSVHNKHTGIVKDCSFSPDGMRIVSASDDNTLKLWNGVTIEEIFTLKGHTGGVMACSFSPNGRRIVSASLDRTLKLWNTETGNEISTLKGHTQALMSCAFSPNGRYIVSASLDQTLKLWNAETGNEISTLKGHTFWVYDCAFSPDGNSILSASSDNTLKLWNTETGAVIFTLKGHTFFVNACAFSPDGQRILSASNDRTLKIWNAESGEIISTLKGHTFTVRDCAFSPDGKRIVSGGDDTLRLWNTETGKEISSLKVHTNEINACDFSPDGRHIVSGGFDKILKIWDGETLEEISLHSN